MTTYLHKVNKHIPAFTLTLYLVNVFVKTKGGMDSSVEILPLMQEVSFWLFSCSVGASKLVSYGFDPLNLQL